MTFRDYKYRGNNGDVYRLCTDEQLQGALAGALSLADGSEPVLPTMWRARHILIGNVAAEGLQHQLKIFCERDNPIFLAGPGSYIYLEDLPCLVLRCVDEKTPQWFGTPFTYLADDGVEYTVTTFSGSATAFGGNLGPFDPDILAYPAAWYPRTVRILEGPGAELPGDGKYPCNANAYAFLQGPGKAFSVGAEDREIIECRGEHRGYNWERSG